MQKGKKFLSDLKLYSDYFKWIDSENRYEHWPDAVTSIVDGHRKKYSHLSIEPYLLSAQESLNEQLVLASQRNLQYRHNQIMKHNMRMYNCTTAHICRNRVFQEIFYVTLCGSGFGGSLLLPFVAGISKIQKRTFGTKTFVIPDSIEGWADALGVLMSSYFVDNQPFPEYAGYEIKFDYSNIRERGSFISGGFKAPGPDGLKQSLERIETLIEKWITTEGNTIRPILAFDIICHAADAVLSGGVRRSALSMIVDPNDHEMINAKIGNWRTENPQRARSNNSVLLLRNSVVKDQFDHIVNLNEGDNDIGFVFANSWFDVFNPCFEIGFTPVLTDTDLVKIDYDFIFDFVTLNQNQFGIQGCNLTEINAEKCTTKKAFLRACKDATILGTLQAGYTNFPYLGSTTEQLFQREALLGVSITGWMNNPALFNESLLAEGVSIVLNTNKELAEVLGINQAARTTCVKPSGNAAVVLGTASGAHPDHAIKLFRIMQLNKDADSAKWLMENMPFLIEESVWSASNSDYVVFVPIENPTNGLYKKDMKGVVHLDKIKFIQQNWVVPGTVKELGISSDINHNTSCTVILDDKNAVVDYIWNNRELFTAVSFISDYGDKDFNQAPFTSVLTLDEIIAEYGDGALFASGLIVDGLHYFNDNLWAACDSVINKNIPLTGNREQVLLKKYWVDRAKRFAKNYFKGDLKKMVYCLKDVHLLHKWHSINKQFKEVDFTKVLPTPTYKDISNFAAMSCSGGSCEITYI